MALHPRLKAFAMAGFVAAALTLMITGTTGCDHGCEKVDRQPATKELIKMVETDPVLKAELTESISLAQRINSDPKTNPVANLEDYYDFIDALVTYDPRNIPTGNINGDMQISMEGKNYCKWNILDLISYSYFLVDRQITTDPRGQIQFANDKFSNWLRNVANSWGAYLETPDSAKYIPEFENDPKFGDWYCPPEGGYKTFQDYFYRELCAANFPTSSRKVEGYNDPLTVASVADSNSLGTWPISRDGKLVTGYDDVSQAGRLIKGKLYSSIDEFIRGGPGEKVLKTFGKIDTRRFNNGTFTHQFLNVNNYHRLHTPVAGRVVYMRHFQAGVRLKSNWKVKLGKDENEFYNAEDPPDWQFGQTRLVLGIETPNHGIVIAAPMGMAQVSAIRLRDWVVLGAKADKGWEFANFAFGGSDFVVIFEPKAKFQITVPRDLPEPPPGAGVNYKPSLQGERYGCLGGTKKCRAKPAKFPPPYPGM